LLPEPAKKSAGSYDAPCDETVYAGGVSTQLFQILTKCFSTKSKTLFETEDNMKRQDWFISIAAGILLAIVVTYFGVTNLTFVSEDASAQTISKEANIGNSDVIKIRNAMLQSHTTWDTIHVVATTTWFEEGQAAASRVSNVYIDQSTYQGKIESSEPGQTPSLYWVVKNGEVYETNLESGESAQHKLPNFVIDGRGIAALAKNVEEIYAPDNNAYIDEAGNETIFRHPFGMLMPSPAADYIFPVGLAQRSGNYTIVGKEDIAGRSAWVIEYSWSGSGPGTIGQRFWVDMDNGVILKSLTFEGSNMKNIIEETIVSSIAFDLSLDANLFELP
jgi:hypothetical protein